MTNYRNSGRHRILWSILPLAVMASSSALAQDEGEITLDAIEVEAESDQGLVQDGYVPVSGRIGSKSETPFVEVPQSVSVITESQLDDRNPASLEDALAYTPGVQTGIKGLDPRYDAFWIRGIDATYNGTFRDGLRRYASPDGVFRAEPYGLEAVEVLKGPSSSLYGATTAGGMVNLVTKKPTEEPFREIELQGGSHHHKQVNFDLSGPVTEKGNFLYRLTGVLRDSETEIDDYPDNRAYIAPAITWKPDEDTTLTILGEYMKSKVGGTASYVNEYDAGGNLLGVTDEYAGDPDFNDFPQTEHHTGYELEHHINDHFTFFSSARYSGLNNDLRYATEFKYPSQNYYRYGRYKANLESFVTDNFLQADYKTGGIQNTSIVGMTYNWVDYNEEGIQVDQKWEGQSPDPNFLMSQKQNQLGVYGSQRFEYNNWILNIGGRYDWLSTRHVLGANNQFNDTDRKLTDNRDDEEFSWRAALSYRTKWGFVPYISYTTSFSPNIGSLTSGTAAEPTLGKQKEVGVKYEVPGYNALITAAAFDIEQEGGLVLNANEGRNELSQPDLRSRGFEVEGVASLQEGLNLTASYSYTDVEIESSDSANKGNTLSGIPKHNFSLFADYTIQDGDFAGLGAGVGLRYQGQSYGDDANRLSNDARFFADASLHYDLGNFDPKLAGARFQVNGYNLLNQQKEMCSGNYCYRDEGRKFIASLRYRF